MLRSHPAPGAPPTSAHISQQLFGNRFPLNHTQLILPEPRAPRRHRRSHIRPNQATGRPQASVATSTLSSFLLRWKPISIFTPEKIPMHMLVSGSCVLRTTELPLPGATACPEPGEPPFTQHSHSLSSATCPAPGGGWAFPLSCTGVFATRFTSPTVIGEPVGEQVPTRLKTRPRPTHSALSQSLTHVTTEPTSLSGTSLVTTPAGLNLRRNRQRLERFLKCTLRMLTRATPG